jgi:hypothetical protein
MSNRSSGSLRYLKARLRILKRPKVWGTVAVLLLIAVLVADYFSRSGQLSSVYGQLQNISDDGQEEEALPDFKNPTASTDIDGLPILDSTSNKANLSQDENFTSQNRADPFNFNKTDTSTADTAPTISGTAVTGFPSQGNGLNLLSPSTAAAGLNTGLNNNSPNSARSGAASTIQGAAPQSSSSAGSTTSQPGYIYGIDGFAPQAPIVRPASPLQTSVNRYSTSAGQADASSSSRVVPYAAPTGITPSTTVQPAGSGQVRSNQGLPASNSGQPFSVQGFSPYGAQTSPPPGTTGYTLPSTLNRSPVQSTTTNPYNLTTPQSLPRTYTPPVSQPTNLGQPAFQGLGYGANPGANATSNFGQPAQP